MPLHDLIRHLGAELGLPELALSPDARCAFSLGPVTLHLTGHSAAPTFTLRSVVGQLSDTDFIARGQDLLAANLATGPRFFAVDANGAVYLTEFFQLPALRLERFFSAIARFTDLAQHWQQRLSAPTPSGG